jgi:hypothetical protein
MSARLNLTREEREQLARLLAEPAARTGREDSLDAMLGRWSAFVTTIERGYEDSIYEYTNDLSVRDRLERVVAGAGPALRAKLQGALAEDDRRFAAATQQANRPLGEFADEAPSWWRRVPRRRVGELAEDIDALGYRAK